MFRPDPKPVKQEKKKPVKSVASLLKKMSKREQLKPLIDELDATFSVFIRTRDIDESGITKCFTCGKVDHWKNLHCGHYWGRESKGTRWDDQNCQPQCFQCNCKKEGNKPAFTVHLLKKYGPGILSTLEINKNRITKVDVFYLEIQIRHYRQKIKERGIEWKYKPR